MALTTHRVRLALAFFCLAFFLVCLADEEKKDDDNTKTIRGKNVSARIFGRSGKIMIVRVDEDKDDTEDTVDSVSNKKDDVDDRGDNDDRKESKDKEDTDDKESPITDRDDKDDNDDVDNSDKDKDDYFDDDFRDDDEGLLSFELDELKEKDADGNEVDDKHCVDSFDDVEFQLSHVRTASRFKDLAVISVNLSTHLKTKANLGIMVYLFLEPGIVTFGNETFNVNPGTVKFNIEVNNWDFCGDSSRDCSSRKEGKYLDLTMKVKSKDSPTEVEDDRKKAVCNDKDNDNDDEDQNENDDDDDDDCPIIYNMGGDSEMLLNKGVMLDDDEYTAMPVGFPKLEIEDETRKFVFRIPKFSKKALVDPSVTPGQRTPKLATSAGTWLQLNFLITVLVQIVVMFAFH